MPRRTIAFIWLAGLLVAALAYAVDPDALLNAAIDLLDAGMAAIEHAAEALSAFGAAMVRALAVGLFVTFVGLALLAVQRGQRAWTPLITVGFVFLLLVQGGASNERWVAAFALAAVGALVMTNRLRRGTP